MIKSYCVKEKKLTDNLNPVYVKTKNGRMAMKSQCASCGRTKSQFIKSTKGSGNAECMCGLDKTKDKCSMKECAQRKQIRYWGKNKVDSRVLNSARSQIDLKKKE